MRARDGRHDRATCCLPGKMTGPAVPAGGSFFDWTLRGELLGGA
jgi:hypothetical protein